MLKNELVSLVIPQTMWIVGTKLGKIPFKQEKEGHQKKFYRK